MIIRLHEYDLRRAVIPTLYIRKLLLIEETSRSKIYQLHPRLPQLLKNYILWFNIAMYDIFLTIIHGVHDAGTAEPA